MTTRNLSDIILEGGVRSVKFFNGRLLSGEDLSQEQEGQRLERRRLGQAIGDGVVSGLEVSETIGVSRPNAPVVTITPGLAINREGTALALTQAVNLSLVPPSPNTTPGESGFMRCGDLGDTGVYVASAGLYLLTIMPAGTTEGRAPVSGLSNVDAACNVRHIVDGVTFRLRSLDLENEDLKQPERLRNLVAHRCFGTQETEPLFRNLFGPEIERYGLVDKLRPNRLADCEVPLALLYWTAGQGMVFLDMWAVRRRVVAPDAGTRWPLLLGDRRQAESEAAFYQFQAQLDDLRQRIETSRLNGVKARDHFRYWPPSGLVPLRDSRWPIGFNAAAFFDGMTTRTTLDNNPLVIEAARVRALLRASLAYPPIDLNSQVLVWVYRVRENLQPIDQNAADAPQSYLVFASGHMPFMGDAHYDVNRWRYSNYGS